MPEAKSKRQVGFLLSSGSPLTSSQRQTLKSELSSGRVTVKENKMADHPGSHTPKKATKPSGTVSGKGKGATKQKTPKKQKMTLERLRKLAKG